MDGLIAYVLSKKLAKNAQATAERAESAMSTKLDKEPFGAALLSCFEKTAWIDETGRYAYLYLAYTFGSASKITRTLTHVSIDNQDNYVINGEPYSATVTADDGYVLRSVICTMDGIEQPVSGGSVSIANVTGDITITAVASTPQQIANYNVVGNPSITSDFILTPSDGNFVKSPEAFNPGSNTWEFRTKIHTNNLASYMDIIGSVDSDNSSVRSFLIELSYTKRSTLYLSSNNNSWDISTSEQLVTDILNNNSDYYLRFGYDGTKYYNQYSTNGESWRGPTKTSSIPIYGGFNIGIGLKRTALFDGTIDLKETTLTVNNALWWSAVVVQ